MDLQAYGCIALGRRALRQLHISLERDFPDHAPGLFQEMGYAIGEELYNAFCAWLPGATGVDAAVDLAADALGPVLSDFFVQAGWGELQVAQLSNAVLAIDALDPPEADQDVGYETPNCYIMTGMLADFLGRVGEATVAVMEVECRSLGAEKCRFLVGSPESMQSVYEYVAAGGAYADAVS